MLFALLFSLASAVAEEIYAVELDRRDLRRLKRQARRRGVVVNISPDSVLVDGEPVEISHSLYLTHVRGGYLLVQLTSLYGGQGQPTAMAYLDRKLQPVSYNAHHLQCRTMWDGPSCATQARIFTQSALLAFGVGQINASAEASP